MSLTGRPPLSCPRCSGRMEEGFLLDEAHGMYTSARWVEGAPVKSIWVGLKLRGRKKLKVLSLRCRSCGLLELYAPS